MTYTAPNRKPVFVLTREHVDAMHNVCVAEDAVLALAREMGDEAPMSIKQQADRIRVGREHGYRTGDEFRAAYQFRPVIRQPGVEVPAEQPKTRRWWSRRH